MTVKEAAARLGLSVSSVYDLARLGHIPCHRVGPRRGRVVLDAADVERYWRAGRREGTIKPAIELKYIKLRGA